MRIGRRLRWPAAALLVAIAWAVVACDEATDRPAPAERRTSVAPQFTGSYTLNGRERRVRTSLAPGLVTRSRRNLYVIVPPARAAVIVDLRVDDRGRDPIDISLLRFAAVDSEGKRLAERFRLPVRKLTPGSKRSPRIVSVAFTPLKTRLLEQVSVRFLLSALRGRASWSVRDPGPR